MEQNRSPDAKGLELPAFRHGAGGDGGRRVHEHHLEEEQADDADIIVFPLKKKPRLANMPKSLPNRCSGEFVIERRHPAQAGITARAAEHQPETQYIEPEHAQPVNHHIHGHGMRGVFRAGEARFD